MTPRALLSLIVLTAVAIIGAIIVLVSEQIASAGDRGGGEQMFAAVESRRADLSQLTLTTARYELRLEFRDGRWVSIDRGDYPVRAEPVTQIIDAIAGLVTFEARTDDPALFPNVAVEGPTAPEPGAQLAPAAVDNPSMQIRAVANDGEVLADAIIGFASRSIGMRPRGGTFVRRTGENQVWLAEGTVIVPSFLPEWFDPLLSIPGPDVARVSIFSGPNLIFDAVKSDFATGNYDLAYLDAAYQRPNITTEDNAVRGMSQAIVSTTFDDARPKDSVTIAPDARTVRYETRTGLRLDITLVTADGSTWVLYNATAIQDTAAAQAADIQARTGNWAFKLPVGRITTLTRDIAQLVVVPVQPITPIGPQPGGPIVPPPVR